MISIFLQILPKHDNRPACYNIELFLVSCPYYDEYDACTATAFNTVIGKMKETVQINYLIANELDITWGLTVNTVGFQCIEPDEAYPPKTHPTGYLFSTQKGRTLDEYILLYITQGKGSFASSSQKQTMLNMGSLILLFPGEWHTYSPDRSTGWDEYWIGFKGENIDKQIKNGFFSKDKPIFNVGPSEEVIQLYMRAINIAKEQKAGFQQVLAGIATHLLGIAYSREKQSTFEDLKATSQMDQAKMIMVEKSHTDINPKEIADQVCMSYSWFRRIFKQYTGLSPLQYIQELRIQKSKELLASTTLTCNEVAFEVGYENPDYFGVVFKKRTGISPTKYREMMHR